MHEMIDRILEVARNEDGMLYNTIDPQTGEHPESICDTWGYNYNGVYVVLPDRRHRKPIARAVRDVLSNLTEHLTDYHWGSADEYADSIEGAINLYNRERVESATTWIDTEIRDMWSVQQPDGVVEGWHGDGNSARTAIMYALWKTRGLTVQPWRVDVRVGAVELNDGLYVSLKAYEPYEGKLVFDKPRHQVRNAHADRLPQDQSVSRVVHRQGRRALRGSRRHLKCREDAFRQTASGGGLPWSWSLAKNCGWRVVTAP